MPTRGVDVRSAALRLGLALVLACGPLRLPAQMLASIPVNVTPPGFALVPGAPAPVLRVRLQVADAPGLARLLGLPESATRADGTLDLTLEAGTHPDLDAQGDPLAASFIVDYHDPEVAQLHQRLVGQAGHGGVGAAQVVDFVATAMHSEYGENLHFASEVARTLRGDCTEHALLTTALARAVQIPARLVNGAAILYTDGQWQAYGHAWVQMREADHWVVRDSALVGFSGPVYYLPAFVVTNEGPGYKLGWVQGIGRVPSRIELLGVTGAGQDRNR